MQNETHAPTHAAACPCTDCRCGDCRCGTNCRCGGEPRCACGGRG